MKPISVTFQCFGPYLERQEIDFTELEKSGLFLITGETGSGKTTILDAICYALYGEASNRSRGELEAMRCKTADKAQPTYVEFIFETNGRRYKFVRSLHMARKKWNDEHNCMEYRDGVYVPIFENPKKTRVNEMARQLIGLSAEQFRQVIVLPQGKFETLLTSDSGSKEEILTSIFHADRWDVIEGYIKEKVDALRKKADEQAVQIRQTLQSFGCERLDALDGKCAETRTQAETLKEQLVTLEKEKEKRQAEATQALLDQKAFDALDGTRAELDALEKQRGAMQRAQEKLRQARQAETIREAYAALQTAEKTLRQAETAKRDAADALEKAQREQAAALEQQRIQEEKRETYQEKGETLRRCIDAEAVYAECARTAEALRKAQTEAQTAQQTVKQRAEKQQTLLARMQMCARRFDAAEAAYKQIRQRYLCSLSGILAQTALHDGAPCPVCGSTAHPAPAAPPPDGVSQQDFDDAEAARGEAKEAFDASRESFERARADTQAAQQAETEALLQLEKAAAQDESARSRMIQGIDTAGQLRQRIETLQEEIRQFEQAQEKLLKDIQSAASAIAAAEALLEQARQSLHSAQEAADEAAAQWRASCADTGFADTAAYLAAEMEPQAMQAAADAQAEYLAKCRQKQELLQTQQQAVQGKTRRDTAELQRLAKEAETAYGEAAKAFAVLENMLDNMQKALQKLREQTAAYDALRLQLEEDAAFHKRIAGSNGMSLKRYVLGVMLTGVTEQANRMLRDVYGGRYCLYRTDESTEGKRRSGLELEVLDSHGNVRRSVKTLSGGEKFLVALSLAIGLSTVVQSQSGGVRLDAMFIDEGFGTLDKNTMQDALDILQRVQQQNGIVGIISHVQALAESIPAQIEIQKTSNGSRCVLHGV